MNILKEIVKCFLAEPLWIFNLKKWKNIGKKAILIGTPVHGNLGDHLIAEEEISFLSNYFSDYSLFECCMPMYLAGSKFIKNICSLDDIIFISGGGWMGSLWLDNEITIRNIIKDFPNNQIVIFPQTAYYTNDTEGCSVMNQTINVIKSHKNILLMLRDYESYSIMKKQLIFSNVKVAYYPDMALYGSFFEDDKIDDLKTREIFLCLRDDREAYIDKDSIKHQLNKSNYKVRSFTTVKNKHIYPRNRKKALKNFRDEIINADVVITDRLHAMIFSLLNGIHCYAFDNKTRKVSGVYEWIKHTNMVTLLYSSENVLNNIAISCEDKKQYSRACLKPYYDKMAKDIRKGVVEFED